jgi:hypothetical protein
MKKKYEKGTHDAKAPMLPCISKSSSWILENMARRSRDHRPIWPAMACGGVEEC